MSTISSISSAMTQPPITLPSSGVTGNALAATALAASTLPSASAVLAAFNASSAALSGNLLDMSA